MSLTSPHHTIQSGQAKRIPNQHSSSGLSKSQTFEILEMIGSVLVDLSKSSFRVRMTSVKSDSSVSRMFGQQMMHVIDGLVAALSLKSDLKPDGEVNVCLASDPVKTFIALPVALDALDDIIYDLNNIQIFGKDSLSLPLLKLNRVSSGSVVASGLELPFGIVISAFDGIRKSKWEEFNGAKDIMNELLGNIQSNGWTDA